MFIKRFLNSTAYFMAPDDETGKAKEPDKAVQKTASELAQEERDKINTNGVSSSETDKDEDEEDKDEEDDEEDEGDDKDDEENLDNETDEQKIERLAKEKEAKEQRKQARQQKRIDRITARAKMAEDEVAKLRAQIAEKPVEGLSEEEVERRAEDKAAQKLKEKLVQDAEREFESLKIKIEKQAVSADKDFIDNVNEMAEESGMIPSVMIGILGDLEHDNGGAVIAFLAKEDNRELYEEIRDLPPIKMGIRLARLSDKLKEEVKPPKSKRERSNAPEPMRPVEESRTSTTTTLTGKESMDEFVRKRNAQIAAKQGAR